MTMKKFFAVLDARNKEFLRDRSSLTWNLLFPFLVVIGFAFAFTGNSAALYKVGLIRGDGAAQATAQHFLDTKYLQFVAFDDEEKALMKLRHHQLDMVLSLNQKGQYWINSTAPKGYIVERILWGGETADQGAMLKKETVEGREIRYVDWLMAGMIGMNMMFSALFGVGYVIVRYRKNGVLKRLKATPLAAWEFLAAQVASRLTLIMAVSAIVFVGSYLAVHFVMLGSVMLLALVVALGAMSLISLGLLVAARVTSEEFAGGILNLLSWPMMFLSGVWFSLEGAHPWVQNFANLFPLTHVISAMRAIMTEGAGLPEVLPQITILSVTTVVFLALGSWLFRWE